MTLVQQLAAFAVAARDHGVPDAIDLDVRRRILDIVGLALAAPSVSEGTDIAPGDAVLKLARQWAGAAEAYVLGTDIALPAPSAALVNGTNAHALDFDDTHLPSVLHPSASVVPAALAVGQATGATAEAVRRAVAVGNEITNRLGMGSYDPSIGNSVFFEHGLHATSICGTLGAAAAASLLYGLDADGVAHAVGIAASMGAGVIEANRTGGSVKRIHCGWAAHSGVVAAQMAAAGVTGPPTVLEGRFGFYEALSRGFLAPDAVVGDLGDRWELVRTFYKPYPSNHFTHAGIDAVLAMRREDGLDPHDVLAIELGVAAPTLRTIAEPRDEKIRPRTGYHGKFSGPYVVATALMGGGGLGVYLDDFSDEGLHDAERMRLCALVDVVADDECTASFPHQFPAVLRVRTRGGATLERRIRHNRGGPQNPLSADELGLKFTLNATRSISAATAAAWRDEVLAGSLPQFAVNPA